MVTRTLPRPVTQTSMLGHSVCGRDCEPSHENLATDLAVDPRTALNRKSAAVQQPGGAS